MKVSEIKAEMVIETVCFVKQFDHYLHWSEGLVNIHPDCKVN
jgi:hypothetical protein